MISFCATCFNKTGDTISLAPCEGKEVFAGTPTGLIQLGTVDPFVMAQMELNGKYIVSITKDNKK